jgi:hypothetical protein
MNVGLGTSVQLGLLLDTSGINGEAIVHMLFYFMAAICAAAFIIALVDDDEYEEDDDGLE